MNRFALDTKVSGMALDEYMAKLIEKNEKQDIDIERGKLTVSILKQMNNRSRLLIDAAKFELKSRDFVREAVAALETASPKETEKEHKDKDAA